jgi:hypothetical protein
MGINKEIAMPDAILVALITGGISLLGTIITVLATMHKTTNSIEQSFKVAQAVTDTKIAELTREVREHNHFAQRIPAIEEHLAQQDKRIDAIDRRTA